MNIVCPLCGFENMAIELPVEFDGGPRVYCCLKVIGETRCEALFTVSIVGVQLSRGVTEEELKLLPPRPRELSHYGIRTVSDHPSSPWEVVLRSTGTSLTPSRSLLRVDSYELVNAVCDLLNQERAKWLEESKGPSLAERNLRRLADFVVMQPDYSNWGKGDGAVDTAINMLQSRAARVLQLERAITEGRDQ